LATDRSVGGCFLVSTVKGAATTPPDVTDFS